MKSYIPVLTIAGSDSSGGAGIQADLKTMSSLGVYGMSAITAITAQNTTGVSAIQGIAPKIVAAQIDMVYADIPPLAVKTGMLYSADIIDSIADALARNNARNIIIDPVMVATSGALLIDRNAIKNLVEKLFPMSILITPNRAEARELTGSDNVGIQAQRLHEMGARNILLKGGDSADTDKKTDYLALEGNDRLIKLESDAIDTRNSHGTGCTLSSAIASYIALGNDLTSSVKKAKQYITYALFAGKHVNIGNGNGPVNHFFSPKKLKLRKL
ncbi:MAG: bifunctional hydroxymethylpyrimidine kinase/phosphomethylpyrimidine kinase [Muribaculaceae bacterium]|nr:bifunctional hydroxymethylpyrimidine kinase/phosphomethylpyrimidine kinase [Muribaculaceae bacterium]